MSRARARRGFAAINARQEAKVCSRTCRWRGALQAPPPRKAHLMLQLLRRLLSWRAPPALLASQTDEGAQAEKIEALEARLVRPAPRTARGARQHAGVRNRRRT